jgi:hypothetical protein
MATSIYNETDFYNLLIYSVLESKIVKAVPRTVFLYLLYLVNNMGNIIN